MSAPDNTSLWAYKENNRCLGADMFHTVLLPLSVILLCFFMEQKVKTVYSLKPSPDCRTLLITLSGYGFEIDQLITAL